jgi:hypothetical protein
MTYLCIPTLRNGLTLIPGKKEHLEMRGLSDFPPSYFSRITIIKCVSTRLRLAVYCPRRIHCWSAVLEIQFRLHFDTAEQGQDEGRQHITNKESDRRQLFRN